MAILKDVELYFCRLDPKRPNDKYNKEQPTWEIQIRTKNKAQAAEWKKLNINVKTETDENDKVYYKANIKKKSKKKEKDGSLSDVQPVTVLNGSLETIDPNSIGNGSVGNIRIFQYPYGDDGKIASMLMAVQVTKHVVYVPKPREDDFDMVDTEVVTAGDAFGGDTEDPEF